MPGDAVGVHHRDEVLGPVARQRRLAEVRVGRQEVRGRGAGVGEVAAAAARHQDLLATAVGVLDHVHAAPAPSGGERAHQPGGAAADHDHVGFHAAHCSGPAPRLAIFPVFAAYRYAGRLSRE